MSRQPAHLGQGREWVKLDLMQNRLQQRFQHEIRQPARAKQPALLLLRSGCEPGALGGSTLVCTFERKLDGD